MLAQKNPSTATLDQLSPIQGSREKQGLVYMTTPTKYKAGPATAGITNELALSFVEHVRNPKNKSKFDHFGDQLNCRLKQCLPQGSRNGCLRNREEDLRQDAAVLLFTSFLRGNIKLARAVGSGCIGEVDKEINRSILAAIKYACLNSIKRNDLEIRHLPSVVEKFAEWSSAQTQHATLAKRLADAGWKDHFVSRREFEIVSAIIAGTPRKEIAQMHGISASGISRLLERIAKALSVKNQQGSGLQR